MNYLAEDVSTVWVSVEECVCLTVLQFESKLQICVSVGMGWGKCARLSVAQTFALRQLLRVRCQFSQPAPFTQEAQRKIWWNVARGRRREMLLQLRLWGEGSKHHCTQLRLCPLDVIGLRKLYATWKAIWWRPKETGNREDNTTTPWPESILKLTNGQGGEGVESQELADYRELSVHSGEHHRLSTFFSFLQTLSCYSSYVSSLPLIFLERVPCPPFLTIYPLYSLWVEILEEKDNCSGV